MTVQAQDPFVFTSGNGISVTFGFNFPSSSPDFVLGAVDGVLQPDTAVVLNPDQSNDPGGNITFLVAPADETSVYIYRDTEASQELIYPVSGRFPAKATERSLDKLTMLIQDTGVAISNRALRVPQTEQTVNEIPTKSNRAGNFLAFDENGQPIATQPVEGKQGKTGPQGEKGEKGEKGGQYEFESVAEMITAGAPLGSIVKTGAGTWRIVNTSGILLDNGLYAIPLTGLFASDFGYSKDNNATDNTAAWEDLISKLDSANAVTVKFNGGEFLCNEMSATDVDIKIKGEGKGKNGTIFINESSGSVFNLTRTSTGDAYRNKLKIIGVAIGRDTLDGIHTASGDHGISITGYNNLEVGDIQINQAGRSGIYIENVYVVNINDIAGGYCGQNNATPPEDEGVVRVNRISTGNSIRFRESYISNSLKTDGLVINNAQSIKVGSSTFESCRNLLKIGTLGQTSRGVSIDTCYFENPSVRSINLTSCYGVLISCAYHNLIGPRSDEVFGCVRLESCDRVEIFGGSWSDPQSVSNPNYKGALELFCGGSMAFNGQVSISATASISKICVEKTGGNRLEFNIRSNRCGVEFESLKGLIKPKVGNVIPNTDLTAWAKTGTISVTSDEFFDGSDMYNITGDGSSSINISSSTAMSGGDEINFSGFISEACRLRIRGRRVSDGGFEDVANAAKLGDVTGVNVAGDYTRRFYVNGIATSDYNLINFIIQPTSSDPVTFAYPQSNLDLVPEDYK
ncbi:tail protein [Vibrio phage K227]